MGKYVTKNVVAEVLPVAMETSLGDCYNLLLETTTYHFR